MSGPPVRFGIIGTGTQGCNLLRFLTRIASAKLVAAADIYPPNLQRAVEIAGPGVDTYAEYRALLDRSDVEAVIIASPLYLHAPMLLDTLDAGKHVFVEKSLFFREEEREPIRRAAAAHPGQVLQIGLHRRSSPLLQVAREMVRGGALGKVFLVHSFVNVQNTWRRPVSDPSLERQINWRMYRDSSGGLVTEMGSHFIDLTNWMLDEEPTAVMGTGGLDVWKDGREVHDHVHNIFEYPSGARHHFSSLLFNGHARSGVVLTGTQGTLELDDEEKVMYFREPVTQITDGPVPENWWAGATVIRKSKKKGGMEITPEHRADIGGYIKRDIQMIKRWLGTLGVREFAEQYDAYYVELVNFIRSIREEAPVVAPLEVGIGDSMACIFANRAIDTGQRVTWTVDW